jgi:hypothetical protein
LLRNFQTNGTKLNLSVFAFEKVLSNVTMFHKNFEAKPTLIGIVLGWVTSQNIQYTRANDTKAPLIFIQMTKI